MLRRRHCKTYYFKFLTQKLVRQAIFSSKLVTSDAQVNADRMYQMARSQELMYLFVTAGVSGFLPALPESKHYFTCSRF